MVLKAGEASELIYLHAQRLFRGRVDQLKNVPLDFNVSKEADAVLLQLSEAPHMGIEHVSLPVQRHILERYTRAIMAFEFQRDREIGRIDPACSDDERLSFVIRNWLVGMPLEDLDPEGPRPSETIH